MNSSSRNRTGLKVGCALVVGAMFSAGASAQATSLAHMGIDTSEFQARRQSVMNAVSGGIVLLHSFSAPKSWSESGFQQDSNFYYLTGLENLHDAILAVDGTTMDRDSMKRMSPLSRRTAIS